MMKKTCEELQLKVKTAQENKRKRNEKIAQNEVELSNAMKEKNDLMISCDTFDQALENVLREVIYIQIYISINSIISMHPPLCVFNCIFYADQSRIWASQQKYPIGTHYQKSRRKKI